MPDVAGIESRPDPLVGLRTVEYLRAHRRESMEDNFPAPVVDGAWHYNRCFPPEEDLSQDGSTLFGLYNGSYTPAPV
jgi:hypothetical protein